MAEKSFPLDNVQYYSSDMRLFHAGRTGGIINFSGDDFAILSVSGMSVTVSDGVAFLKTGRLPGGVVYRNTGDLTITMDAPTAATRYDYISIRYDETANYVSMKAVRGGSGFPQPVRTGGIWEIIIAVVKVNANSASIDLADVYDTRMDENLCGLCVDTLTRIPTQTMYQQFNAFLSDLQLQLGGNTAGKLQAEIDKLSGQIDSIIGGSGSIEEMAETLSSVKGLSEQNAASISSLTSEIHTLKEDINARPQVLSIGPGLELTSSGALKTTSPDPKIGTSDPTVDMLEDGQIYLQV